MNLSESAPFSENAGSVAPILSAVVPAAQISPSLVAALDACESERASFMALADDLVQSLRPELERMTTEWVQRSVRQAWVKRFRP